MENPSSNRKEIFVLQTASLQLCFSRRHGAGRHSLGRQPLGWDQLKVRKAACSP